MCRGDPWSPANPRQREYIDVTLVISTLHWIKKFTAGLNSAGDHGSSLRGTIIDTTSDLRSGMEARPYIRQNYRRNIKFHGHGSIINVTSNSAGDHTGSPLQFMPIISSFFASLPLNLRPMSYKICLYQLYQTDF